ncbi:tetratricopeptide repeat protein [Streptomyces viridochromogenes]|nr:tetratricopeptide repeat protein [Streptomyces viridochromogenes]
MNAAAPWPRWSAKHQPGSLIQYVQREASAHYLGSRMPGPSGDPPAVRTRALYEAFAARDIQYVDEPSSSETGFQAIRPPHEVLESPRHGTCLDLAVTFAGACLYAGLHPLIVVLPPTRPGAPAHAVVAVRLYGGWPGRPDAEYRRDETEPAWEALPADFLRELADDQDSPGSYLAVDIAGVSSRSGAAEARRRQQLSWQEAVAYGTELLRSTEQERWIVTLDVGLGYSVNETYPLPSHPSTDPLTPPYIPIDGETGPLQQLWARHDVIRFLPRDELDFLQDWFQAPDPDGGPRTRVALLHGQGGAGKTRLAAELASRLSQDGWYAGFLVRSPDPRDLGWLGHMASPLLVVVDYVEDAKSTDVVNLLRAVRRRTDPTCLILTARTVSGWWEEIAEALRHEAHPYVLENRQLKPRHPRQNDVYRAALHSFGGSRSVALASTPPPDPYAGRWTTLDLVMLGWLAARQDGDDLPESEEDLYEEIFRHELKYWKKSYKAQVGKPSESLLREVGACISLLAPRAERLDNTLKAIEGLAEDHKWRREVAELFVELLPVTPEDGSLAVRPDPVGSHLAAREFGSDQRLLRRCLEQADEYELLNACVGLSRVSASSGAELATGLAVAALNDVRALWAPALAVAATQGGPFVRALERVAESEETWLPLAELAATLPMGHTNLRQLALIATERSAPQGPGDGTEAELAVRASWLNNLAVRQNESGDREAALVSATEAVRHYLELVEVDADSYLPDLAMALNNLAVQQSETGDRQAALITATQAVHHHRTLAEANPTANLPNLARALNNLAVQQSQTGDRQAALTTATQAVEHYRTLTQTNPAAFLPDLARALNNLAIQKSEAGDRQAALTTATQAVEHYRTLTEADPAAFLPDLATVLNNLANRQSETGDRQAALTTATEAVHHYRTLTEANPAAFLPDLASALNNLANHQRQTGDRRTALATATEAVEHYRTLTEANPAAFLPDLATALNNLANRQSETGDRQAALTTATEAVTIRRTLVEANPAVFLPNLAMALNNLAVQQNETGDRQAAFTTSTEAVEHYRTLAEANPAAFLPDLARALNNLANHQRQTGDRRTALATATEAVEHYRTLSQTNPAAFLPDLARALNNLAVQQNETGDRQAAFTTSTEAVEHYRTLTQTNPAAFLPDLARALNNLAVQQNETGDRQAAFTTSTEAVEHYRTLTEANPAAYLPDLAAALNNLANHQYESGDHQAALATATEAVEHYRTLTEANPAAFLPDLATALNNLANRQSEAGDRQAALTTATEAVTIRRTLVEANPAAHLPNLARALNNLANRQGEAGDRQAALTTATEAVHHYRTLTETNPAAYLPNLAMALNNLANRQSEAGDRQAALTTATEAVHHYRTLTETNPAAYLPNLAMALNNLANRQSEAGDRQAALTTATEAVHHYRTLTETNPAAYLPNLAMALNNLTDWQREAMDMDAAIRASNEVLAGLAPGPHANLLTFRAAWRLFAGDSEGAVDDLFVAALRTEEEEDPEWTARSRRATRAFFSLLVGNTAAGPALNGKHGEFPPWVTATLSPGVEDFFAKWLAAEDWSEQETLLREAYPLLRSEEGRANLGTLRDLHLGSIRLETLIGILDGSRIHGLDKVLRDIRAAREREELVNRWLNTSTWNEDLAFLMEHKERLCTDPEVRELLGSDERDSASLQHLGILELADRLPLHDVYDAITDPVAAVDTAMDLLDQGALDALHPLFLTMPSIQRASFVTPYLLAVYSALFLRAAGSGQEAPDPAQLMTEAAAQASDVQRGAGVTRLRRLARRRPEHATVLMGLADTLAVAPSIAPTDQSVPDAE